MKNSQKFSAVMVLVLVSAIPLSLRTYSLTMAIGAAVVLTLAGFYFFNTTWSKSQDDLVKMLSLLSSKDPLEVERRLISTPMADSSKKAISSIVETYYLFLGNFFKATEQVDDYTDDLIQGYEVAQNNLGEISATMQNIASGTDAQSDAAQKAAANVDALTGLAEEMAEMAKASRERARQVKDMVSEGKEFLEALAGEIKATAQANSEAAARMHKLESAMTQIGDFVNVVTEIADQTNLLALNAAIEAARAGEHGRGFAVVAEEVRKLAEESAAAAKNISSLANNIQVEAKVAAETVENNVTLVEKTMERSRDTQKIFHQIDNATVKVTSEMEEILNHSQEHAQKVREVAEATSNSAAVTQQTAASIQEISAAGEEQQAVMENINQQIRGLLDIARGFKATAFSFIKFNWNDRLIDEMVNYGWNVLEQMARSPVTRSLDNARVKPVYDAKLEEEKYFQAMLLVRKDGTAAYCRPFVDVKDWSFRKWFQASIKGEKFKSEPFVALQTNRLAISIAVPVRDDKGQIIGVLSSLIAPPITGSK
ncbi:MAG: methyl-accepting chemotaxis protein [Bacillota bacterium]